MGGEAAYCWYERLAVSECSRKLSPINVMESYELRRTTEYSDEPSASTISCAFVRTAIRRQSSLCCLALLSYENKREFLSLTIGMVSDFRRSYQVYPMGWTYCKGAV